MPITQTMLTSLNVRFSHDNLHEVPVELFAPGRRLSEAVRDERLRVHHFDLAEYLDRLPPAIHEAIRAAVQSALTRSPRSPVTFAWAPGYDYELSIWDTPAAGTPGGITILLRTRYPDDPHPLGA
ncbi:MAG TPA: hypothetical protein VE990_06455 [Acidimicrobiales bacterium]|nr:hypothetical protein [Acidimicrobiales bacterium]